MEYFPALYFLVIFKVTIPFLAYLISLVLFLSVDFIIIGFETRKIAKIIYIVLGLFLLIPKLI